MLLPYLLGSLWQIKKVAPDPDSSQTYQNFDPKSLRKNICDISQIYFQDFIQRCLDYNVISAEPPALKLLREFHEIEVQKEEPGSGDTSSTKKQMNLISKYFDSSDRREQKVKTFRETKELEGKIKAVEQRQKVSKLWNNVLNY